MDIKDFSKEKSIKVNCSFCGNEIECPESMLEKANKHMCYECFITKELSDEEIKDVHVDIPRDKMSEFAASEFADNIVEETFSALWSDRKEELKEMSKKDLAQEMFGAGVYLGVKEFIDSMKQLEDQDNEDKGKQE
ncbi:hypothetical protein HYW21_03730 [Candidatus Woesearchaeota archaeon]|nr:hypothetical protein [Candidatus Woesearchaeota archaeon]